MLDASNIRIDIAGEVNCTSRLTTLPTQPAAICASSRARAGPLMNAATPARKQDRNANWITSCISEKPAFRKQSAAPPTAVAVLIAARPQPATETAEARYATNNPTGRA